MDKFIAAYKNEMIKLKHKKSIWIIGICMSALIILISLSIFFVMSTNALTYDYDEDIEIINDMIVFYQEELGEKTGADIKDSDMGGEIYKYLCEIEYYKTRRTHFEKLKEKNINTNAYWDYRMELLNVIAENNYEIAIYNNIIKKYELEDTVWNMPPYSNTNVFNQAQADKLQAISDQYIQIVENNDFAAYIAIKNAEILADDTLDTNEKRIAIENNNLRLEGNITGEFPSHTAIIDGLSELTQYKISVETGIDYSNALYLYGLGSSREILTPSKLEDYKKEIEIIEYKFENGYYNIGEDSSKTIDFNSVTFAEIIFSVGMLFIFVLMIMLSGSIISAEMSNGSVKMLAVSPVKRWKIFTAKCFALLTIAFAACMFLSLLIIVISGILFGFSNLVPYVYYGANSATSLPFAVYVILYSLTYLIQAIFYSSLAMMLSALTKNTAVSIGVSLGVSYVMSAILSIVTLFVDARWTKYIPTESLSTLVSSVFSESPLNTITNITQDMFAGTSGTNIWFSAIYVAVLIIAMIFTARDSFCRKDIK